MSLRRRTAAIAADSYPPAATLLSLTIGIDLGGQTHAFVM